MASAVLDLPVVVGSRRLEGVASTCYGPLNHYYISRRGSPLLVGWGDKRAWPP